MYSYRDYRPDRRFQMTVAISPDGREVAYSDNRSGQFNLVVAPLDGGPERRLTSYDDATVRNVDWTPDGQHVIFMADRNGDEFNQIYRIPREGGEAEALTDEPKVQYFVGQVSPDGRLLSYAGNDRDEMNQDVIVRDLASGETWRPYTLGGSTFAAFWAPDSRRLTAAKASSNTEQTLYLLSLDGEPEQLLPAPGEPEPYAMPGPWLPDGSGFLIRTDAGRDFVGVSRFDLATREVTPILTPDWDVEDVALSEDGRVIVWAVNNNGVSELHAAELATLADGVEMPKPGIPAGPIGAMSVDRAGRTAAILIATGARPMNVAAVDIAAGTSRWITDSVPPAGGAVEPALVTFTAHDGREIPAWLYRPAGDGPCPVVLSIHGGPEAQERPSYNYGGFYQYLVSKGIAVLAPNVRGSNGYGRTYQRLILRDWGGDDLRDFESATLYLRGLDWVDAERIAVFGGSYGGFATLSCVSRLPRYFAAAVDVVGPANLVTFAKSVPPTWRAMMAAWVGDPETEVDFLMARSPVTYAHQIVAPLFVIQGANDPRVVKAESDTIVEALRARGVEVRYDVYDDEGHGFTRTENEVKGFGDAAEFLIAHLT